MILEWASGAANERRGGELSQDILSDWGLCELVANG